MSETENKITRLRKKHQTWMETKSGLRQAGHVHEWGQTSRNVSNGTFIAYACSVKNCGKIKAVEFNHNGRMFSH